MMTHDGTILEGVSAVPDPNAPEPQGCTMKYNGLRVKSDNPYRLLDYATHNGIKQFTIEVR
jgi:hypothetical protein